MKKKYFYILAAALIAVVTSCSLYLEEDDIRTLHTEDGYTSEKTISSTDGTTVTYQYNQRTIPIDDEVEEYIVKVESDTILYFVDGTPDHLLPEEGEMMVCSFRDRFPHAFCHRCIERTQVNGLYRCVFTPCAISEAFDKFNVDAVVKPSDYIFPGDARILSSEEMDSILNASEYDNEEEAAAARQLRQKPLTRSWLDNWNFDLDKKSINKEIKTTLEVYGGIVGDVKNSANVTGSITLGLENVVHYDRDHEELDVASGFFGKIDLTFDVTCEAGYTLNAPVSIPIAGVKLDFIVVGAEGGFTATPYMTIHQQASVVMKVCYGFNFVTSYVQKGKDNQGTMTVKGDNEKKADLPVFTCSFKTEKQRKLNVQMGVDFRLGMGAKVEPVGELGAGVGAKVYAEVNQDMDDLKYHSYKEFRDKNANFPTFIQPYVEGHLDIIAIGGSIGQTFTPIKCKILKIPFFPVIDKNKFSFYCSRHSPRTFKGAGAVKDNGLLGAFYLYTPVVRIYDYLTDEQLAQGFEPELVEELRMKFKKGEVESFYVEERSNKIQTNKNYIAQFAYDTNEGGVNSEFWFNDDAKFYWPLYDLKFNTVVPEIYIVYTDDIYHDYGPFQKVVKGTENDILPQYNTYNYCYTIDAMAQIHDSREIRKWGIHMNDNYSNSAEFEKRNDGKKDISEATVRFYWYSNRKQVNLSFWGYCYAGKEADRVKFTDSDHAASIQIEYNPAKSYRSPTDDTPDYDVEQDNDRKSRMSRPYSDDDVIMSFVDAGTGDYCEVVSVSVE